MIVTPAVGAPHRVARTSAAAGVALAAAAGGHLAAGAAVPSTPGVLAAAGVLALPAWWLTGRERGWGLLAGALVAGQLAAHAMLTMSAPTGGGQVGAARTQLHESAWLPADLMLLGHLLAAAVAAVWLRRGERRAWVVARRATAALDQTLAVLLGPVRVPADLGVRRRDTSQPHPLRQPAVLRNTIILRGPPLAAGTSAGRLGTRLLPGRCTAAVVVRADARIRWRPAVPALATRPAG